MKIETHQGNIVELDVDVIVNAANHRMLGGGGVDGAIHKAAGPGLKAECAKYPEVEPGVRCPTGLALITGGHNLKAEAVVHTVGPIFPTYGLKALRAGEEVSDDPEGDLARCVWNSLAVATNAGHESIAFPAISCGIFGGKIETFARIAIPTVQTFNRVYGNPFTLVVFCLFLTAEIDEFLDAVENFKLL